jgi:hypothetical protein
MNTENNKIIAEFLGLKTILEQDFLDYKYNQNETDNLYILESLKYDSDWNSLMEVVEKIENLKYFQNEIQFKITKYAVCIQTITKETGIVISPCVFSKWATYGGTEKLQATYKTVVQFIKWYNLQNS